MRWADGYVLVYSVVSRKSFQLLQEVQKRVEDFRKGASVPIVILANKSDLAHMRQVTTEEGMLVGHRLYFWTWTTYVLNVCPFGINTLFVAWVL